MRVELFPFQKRALADIRMKTAEAMGSYHRTHAPQVVSFTAPTGAGKTIIIHNGYTGCTYSGTAADTDSGCSRSDTRTAYKCLPANERR